MPYTGTIYWETFLSEMKRVGYKGDLSFETAGQYSSKKVPKELIPAFVGVVGKIGEYFRAELEK